jgi:hypothetical protein
LEVPGEGLMEGVPLRVSLGGGQRYGVPWRGSPGKGSLDGSAEGSWQ